MPASTISRATWTDGVSGTLINNARLQADIYDRIDTLIASAITFGSTITAEGFGNHLFSAAGTGANALISRNTSAGTGNYAGLVVGNDTASNLGTFRGHSSTFTTGTLYRASGCTLEATGTGGLVIAASNASGALWFLSANTLRTTVNSAGHWVFGSNATESNIVNWQLRTTGGNPSGQLCINGDGTGYRFAIARNNAGTVTDQIFFQDNGDILPATTGVSSLGSASLAWNRLFMANGSAANPSLTAGSDTNTGIYFDGADALLISTGGTQRISVGTGTSITGSLTVSSGLSVTGAANAAGVLPNSDDLYDLGGVSDRWDDVYATNATIQTSDRNLKKDIAALPLGLAFLRGLRPVQYRWNREGRKGTGRLHAGFIAQEVLTAAPDISGFGLVTGEGTEANRYGLRYTELIAPLVAAVQELAARLEAVETR
jgi:hypothetical protein